MGAAIPVKHYTGMAAASFTPSSMPAYLSHAASISALGIAGIVADTFIVLGLALLTSWVDKRSPPRSLNCSSGEARRTWWKPGRLATRAVSVGNPLMVR